MSPTYQSDLSLKKGCIYNLSFFCVCIWLMGAIFQNLSPSVTLKMGSRSPKSNGSRSPKSNQFLFRSQQYSCPGLVKIHPFILEILRRKAIFQQSERSCALENKANVTKSNQFFFMSQQYSCASLVKIHPFLCDRVQTSHFSTI